MNNDKKKSVAIGRALLSGPYLIWMIGFTIIPLALIFWYGITTKNGNLTLANITAIMSPDHWKALWLSLGLSLISTVLCLVLAYPLAMILRGRGSSASGFIVFIFILPMWMNFLIRTYSWITILSNTGLINTFLQKIGLIDKPIKLLLTPGAVILGMVYDYIPYMILPIYSVMSKLDKSLLEAAEDLGSNSFTKFKRVIFPLTKPGVISGITMVFVPSVSTFYISQKLGGTKTMLIGDTIEYFFNSGPEHYNIASAISMVLMVMILICLFIMNRFSDSDDGGVLM